jgi:hypothetical protein
MEGAGDVFRLETINDLSLQTVVIWEDQGLIHVVIVATTVGPDASRSAHDERVAIAVAVAGAGPDSTPATAPSSGASKVSARPGGKPVLPSRA